MELYKNIPFCVFIVLNKTKSLRQSLVRLNPEAIFFFYTLKGIEYKESPAMIVTLHHW